MIWVLKCFSLSRLLTSYVVNSKPLSRDSAMDITDTVLAGKLRQVFFEGHINGKMNRWRIMQIPMSCTACSISSYISHTHTQRVTTPALAHLKHMVRLIGLTWQQSR